MGNGCYRSKETNQHPNTELREDNTMTILIASSITATLILTAAAILLPPAVHFSRMELQSRNQIMAEGSWLEKTNQTGRLLYHALQNSARQIAQRILKSPSIRMQTEDRLRRARLDEHITAIEYTCIRIFMAIVLVSTNIALYLLVRLHIQEHVLLILIAGVYFLPDYVLEQRAKRYDGLITRDLPQTIDMLLICAESGMGLMNSFEIVAEKKGGLMGKELRMCLQEIHLGIRLQEALHNMTRRCKSKELQMFVNSITQAMRMGTPVQGILRNLSASIRDSERQRLESRIGSIPMKLTIATMIFFMPLVFIIVLFPSLLSFMQSGW